MTAIVDACFFVPKKITHDGKTSWKPKTISMLPMTTTIDQTKTSEIFATIPALDPIEVQGVAAFSSALAELKPVDDSQVIWLKYGHDRFVVADTFDPIGPCWETKGNGKERVRTIQHPNRYEFLVSKEKEHGGGVFLLHSQPQGYPLKECVVASDNICVELDNGTPQEQWNKLSEFVHLSGLKPQKILTSGGKSYHAHWYGTEHFPIEQTVYLRRLTAIALMSDPAACNPHQPMRVEGFDRHENGILKGHQTRVYQSDNRYTYDETMAGLKRHFAAKGIPFPDAITDEWWSTLKRPLKANDLDGLKIELSKGLAGYEAEKKAKTEKTEKARQERLKQWGNQPVTDGLGNTLSEYVEQAKHRLGTSLYKKYGYEEGDRRFCCPWHSSQSKNSAWVSPATDGIPLFHCPTCTDERGVNSFQFFLRESKGSFEIPKGKEYVESVRGYCQLVGIEPHFSSLNSDDNSQSQVKNGSDHQATKKDDNNGDRAIAIAQKIPKEGTLGDRFFKLLNIADETTEDILKAAVLMSNDCPDAFKELEQWIELSFAKIAKTQLKRAISIVGIVIGQWEDETINCYFQKLIKDNSHLTRADLIGKIFKSAINTINPQKTQKEIAMNAVRRCYKDGFKYNELTGKIELNGAEFKDIETAYMHSELIKVDVSKTLATDAILVLGKQQRYHPVKNYLESLNGTQTLSDEQWDNLAFYLLGTNDQLAQIILKKALIAAVARIYKPGCYVRMITTLVGDQNAGKSTFLRLLAGNEFFSDSLGKLDNPKDDYQLLNSYWIHEWGEIDKLNKKTSGDIKAFITKTKDDYRAPYARSPETHQRQCVIFGSCNRDDFLKDSTGNTRFSVIEVGKINLDLVKEWRDSIWATAKARFEAGEQWELTQAEQALSEINNQAYTELDSWHEDIETFISIRQEVSVAAILDHLGIETSKKDSRNAKRVRDVLTTLGWRKDKNPSTYQGLRTRLWRSPLAPRTADTTVVHNSSAGCAGVVQGVVQHESQVSQAFHTLDTTCTTKNTQIFYPEISQKNQSSTSAKADDSIEEFSENLYKEKCCAGCVDLTESLTTKGIEVCTTPAQPLTQPPCTTPDTTLRHNPPAQPPCTTPVSCVAPPIAIDDTQQQKIVKQLLAAKTLADLKQSKRQWGEDVVNFVFYTVLTDAQKAQVTKIAHSVKAITIGSKVTFERHDGLMGGGTVMEIDALGFATLDTTEMRSVEGLILSDGGAA